MKSKLILFVASCLSVILLSACSLNVNIGQPSEEDNLQTKEKVEKKTEFIDKNHYSYKKEELDIMPNGEIVNLSYYHSASNAGKIVLYKLKGVDFIEELRNDQYRVKFIYFEGDEPSTIEYTNSKAQFNLNKKDIFQKERTEE